MAFKKKFDVGTDGSVFFVMYYGERTGQVYNSHERCQEEVDKLYGPNKPRTKTKKQDGSTHI